MTQRVVSFHYTVKDESGQVIDSSKGRPALSYMEGVGQIIPGLENELTHLKRGDKKTVQVAAAEAYGPRDASRVVKVGRHELPTQDVKLGDRFSGGQDAHGPFFIVTHLTEKEVTLDGNHALAGKDLTFDVELIEVRDATADEISHGHAHGEHGHSH